MVRVSLVLSSLAASAAFAPLSVASPAKRELQSLATEVFVRIEGANSTIFDGVIKTRGRVVKPANGAPQKCDGTNNGANPSPGPTCTTAMADVALLNRFSWDATWSTEFEDFFVTRIGTSSQTSTQFWGLLVDWQFTPVGGCQQHVSAHDHVLWAFDAFNANAFLKLDGPTRAKVGTAVQVTVTDGTTGRIITGASIAGPGASSSSLSDAEGKVTVSFTSIGQTKIKAQKEGTIRSNSLTVVVSR